jgi:hypothetical protein
MGYLSKAHKIGQPSGYAILLAALIGVTMYAQEYRGKISGTVIDGSQSAIGDARATLVNNGTNVPTVAITDKTGHYLFDQVEPGVYTLSIEAPGFVPYREQSIKLGQHGDVTVDAKLNLGNVNQAVTVTAQSAQVEFNSTNLQTTVDSQITANAPQFYRDPFYLSKADPSVVQNETRLESQPYHDTGTGTQQIGGINGMDLQIDGASVSLGIWTGYVPAPDMVQEANVQVNTVDAEFGQSRGSAISLTFKSGSNQVHGLAFYQGEYPWSNAILDRVTRTQNVQRKHIFGGSVSNPILRNKWFNFAAYEGWEFTDPQTLTGELPTALERTGNYSQSLNGQGGLRIIYDPMSTLTSTNGLTVTRTPFVGNIIPASRISQVASAYTAALPSPTGPGTGPYHDMNYLAPLPLYTPYKNFSDRTDVVLSDKLRLSGRASLFRTPITAANPTGSDLAWQSDRPTNRNAMQLAADLTWMKSPTTVITANFIESTYIDESAPTTTFKGYSSLWPNSSWYKPMFDSGVLPQLSPNMQITQGDGGSIMNSYASGLGGAGSFWRKHPWEDEANIKISRQEGKHYLKSGFETKGARVWQILQISYPDFTFDPVNTANTYVSPNTALSGDGYASFLLGAPSGGQMPERVATTINYRSFGLFLNDDWRINSRITLNLGLRWEDELPFSEANNDTSRGLDLSVPLPALQGAGAPQMPASVQKYYTGPWIFNGSYLWSSNNHPGQWNGSAGTLSPRAGIAVRVNNKTALRIGYGRYVTPWLTSTDITQAGAYGFALQTNVPAPVLGIPQMSLDNPFPSSYPLPSLPGKTLGQYTGVGDNLSWINQNRPRQYVNRLSGSLQRELPFGVVAELTYFLNRFNAPASRNINQVDPRIAYTYKGATNVSVPNPFYQLLPPNEMPGALRNQPTVPLSALMVPYPQYGSLTVTDYENNGGSVYQQGAIRLRKSYGQGLSVVGGYSYTYSYSKNYYDDIATYLQNRTWQADTTPRQRVTFGGYWELPVGRGKLLLRSAPRAVNAIVSGWSVSPMLTWRSGDYLSFAGMLATGADPSVPNPGPNGWFNTSMFAKLPAYTPRTNPVTYSGLTGPGFFNLDASLKKDIHITEKISAQLRMDVFNVSNSMTWNDPSTSVTSTYFGKSSDQLNLYGIGLGRQTQLGLRIHF